MLVKIVKLDVVIKKEKPNLVQKNENDGIPNLDPAEDMSDIRAKLINEKPYVDVTEEEEDEDEEDYDEDEEDYEDEEEEEEEEDPDEAFDETKYRTMTYTKDQHFRHKEGPHVATSENDCFQCIWSIKNNGYRAYTLNEKLSKMSMYDTDEKYILHFAASIRVLLEHLEHVRPQLHSTVRFLVEDCFLFHHIMKCLYNRFLFSTRFPETSFVSYSLETLMRCILAFLDDHHERSFLIEKLVEDYNFVKIIRKVLNKGNTNIKYSCLHCLVMVVANSRYGANGTFVSKKLIQTLLESLQLPSDTFYNELKFTNMGKTQHQMHYVDKPLQHSLDYAPRFMEILYENCVLVAVQMCSLVCDREDMRMQFISHPNFISTIVEQLESGELFPAAYPSTNKVANQMSLLGCLSYLDCQFNKHNESEARTLRALEKSCDSFVEKMVRIFMKLRNYDFKSDLSTKIPNVVTCFKVDPIHINEKLEHVKASENFLQIEAFALAVLTNLSELDEYCRRIYSSELEEQLKEYLFGNSKHDSYRKDHEKGTNLKDSLIKFSSNRGTEPMDNEEYCLDTIFIIGSFKICCFILLNNFAKVQNKTLSKKIQGEIKQQASSLIDLSKNQMRDGSHPEAVWLLSLAIRLMTHQKDKMRAEALLQRMECFLCLKFKERADLDAKLLLEIDVTLYRPIVNQKYEQYKVVLR